MDVCVYGGHVGTRVYLRAWMCVYVCVGGEGV